MVDTAFLHWHVRELSFITIQHRLNIEDSQDSGHYLTSGLHRMVSIHRPLGFEQSDSQILQSEHTVRESEEEDLNLMMRVLWGT